jgi:hypothetical protein
MLKQCDNCKREENHEGQFDCEHWVEDQNAVLLCDDCFFNDLYKGESND